jgi:hypothetical protein
MLRLFALHQMSDKRPRQNRILAQIFERASIPRLARDIHAASQRHVVSLSTQFFAN